MCEMKRHLSVLFRLLNHQEPDQGRINMARDYIAENNVDETRLRNLLFRLSFRVEKRKMLDEQQTECDASWVLYLGHKMTRAEMDRSARVSDRYTRIARLYEHAEQALGMCGWQSVEEWA